MTKLEQDCIQKIAEAKLLSIDAVSLDTTLESIGVDSLDRVSLSFDLEDLYGVEIPESKLHEIRTVGDVAEAIQQALQRKSAAANERTA